MLTREAARLQVLLELRSFDFPQDGPGQLVIVDDHVIERLWGWVFPYTTRGFLDGNDDYAIAGNGPIMVNRYDGSVNPCGTAYPMEYYIQDYEAKLAGEAADA